MYVSKAVTFVIKLNGKVIILTSEGVFVPMERLSLFDELERGSVHE